MLLIQRWTNVTGKSGMYIDITLQSRGRKIQEIVLGKLDYSWIECSLDSYFKQCIQKNSMRIKDLNVKGKNLDLF